MAQFPGRIESKIEEKEREFDLLDQVYPLAVARVEGRDLEWEGKKKQIQERIARAVLTYKFDDPPHKAVAIVAQIQAECRELLQPQKIVDDWQEVKKELHFLHREADKQKEAAQNAERAYKAEKDRWGRHAVS